MKRIKTGFIFLMTIIFATNALAQSLEDGKKFFCAEKYKSSSQVFSNLINANPANIEAIYWLGLSKIELGDIEGAKALYQKELMANSNNALLIAAMGHIELHEGKTADARQRFETALSLSQSKNVSVLNAIGYANADVKNGDADYAIDKLKIATSIKGMKDADVWVNLGDAYRKKYDGGSAQSAYETALSLNKNCARGSFRIGKIYQTQGPSQEDIFMRYYNEAMQRDVAFAPVYYQLYDYYYKRDVNKSREYLDKYIQYADADPKNCYYQSAMLYASGLFTECIEKADYCFNTDGTNAYVKLYGLKAYSYDKLGDSINAKKFFEEYIKRQVHEEIGPTDYATYAKNLMKFTGNDSLASTYYDKAFLVDSTRSGKLEILKAAATAFESQKNYLEAAKWYSKIVTYKENPNNVDLYYAGFNFSRGGDIKNSIAIFDQYIQKYPTESFGYYMNARNYIRLDSSDASGKGLSNYLKIVEMADSLKTKPAEVDRLKNSLRYLIEYYANVRRDKTSALVYCDKGIEIDPNDTEFTAIKEQILKMQTKPATSTKSTKPAAAKKP